MKKWCQFDFWKTWKIANKYIYWLNRFNDTAELDAAVSEEFPRSFTQRCQWHRWILGPCKYLCEIKTFLKIFFFASGIGFPLYPEIFYIIHNDPAAHQDYSGRYRIRTRNLSPRSPVRYQWTTTSLISHHKSKLYICKKWPRWVRIITNGSKKSSETVAVRIRESKYVCLWIILLYAFKTPGQV